jgi:hypothetical protein
VRQPAPDCEPSGKPSQVQEPKGFDRRIVISTDSLAFTLTGSDRAYRVTPEAFGSLGN